jgi:hypothetical protein
MYLITKKHSKYAALKDKKIFKKLKNINKKLRNQSITYFKSLRNDIFKVEKIQKTIS